MLELLENASMNEFVRENLSEKKKIKDLFLVVINAIDINQNRKLISCITQFASNLCYGNGKFRAMLRSENSNSFFSILKKVLKSTEKQDKDDKATVADKVLLSHAILSLIGNLCVD